MNKNTVVKILLVEDNEGDIVLTLEALRLARVTNSVQVVRDGEEALEYLKKEGKYTDAQTPNLILLDINLPKIDGKEVLMEIKMDKNLRVIPVVMLTTSDSEKDIMYSYQHHVNCYITKPVDLKNFMDMIQKLNDFWITIVHLPNI